MCSVQSPVLVIVKIIGTKPDPGGLVRYLSGRDGRTWTVDTISSWPNDPKEALPDPTGMPDILTQAQAEARARRWERQNPGQSRPA